MCDVKRITLFLSMLLVAAVTGQPVDKATRELGKSFNPRPRMENVMFRRIRRDNSNYQEHHVINPRTDCMLISSDEGQFFYKSPWSESTVCGIFLVAEPDKKIEVVFDYLDVPCENGGLVAWIDGWELNGEVFPSERDGGPIDGRVVETCGSRRPKKLFMSGQNAALVQYRIPSRGKGFIISVRHVHNNIPCNVLLYGAEGVHTIRNYGRPSNCSVTSVSPSSVEILSLNVGMVKSKAATSIEIETGTIYKCHKRGFSDYVEIGGSTGLDNTNMELVDNICGIDSNSGEVQETIACESTSVRLVSSGQHDNSVTVTFGSLQAEQILTASVFCEI